MNEPAALPEEFEAISREIDDAVLGWVHRLDKLPRAATLMLFGSKFMVLSASFIAVLNDDYPEYRITREQFLESAGQAFDGATLGVQTVRKRTLQ